MLQGNPRSGLRDRTIATLYGVTFPLGGIILEMVSEQRDPSSRGCAVCGLPLFEFLLGFCETLITIVSINHSNLIQLSAASRWEGNQRRSREEEEERDSPKRGN
jgi:hypothetical protein